VSDGALRGTVAGCILGGAMGWNVGNLGGVASEMADAYGVSLAAVGLMTTALFLTHASVQVAAGRASDRLGPLGVAIAGVCVICAGDLVVMIDDHVALAIAGRALTGVGTGLAFLAGLSIVRQTGGGALAQGLYGGLTVGAGGVAIAVVPVIVDAIGWRGPFLSSLVLCVAAIAIVLGLRPEPQPVPPHPHGRVPLSRLAGDTRLLRLAVVFSASFALSLIIGAWVTELLERHSDLSSGEAAAVGSLTLMLGVVSRPAGGWLTRTYPARTRATVAASLVAGGAGTLLLVAAQSAWPALLGGLLVGFAAGIPFAPCLAGMAAVSPDAPATAIGVVNGIANAVILVGTPLAGATFSMPGEGRLAFVAIAALWFFALVALPSREAVAEI
jgi:MFS family permease